MYVNELVHTVPTEVYTVCVAQCSRLGEGDLLMNTCVRICGLTVGIRYSGCLSTCCRYCSSDCSRGQVWGDCVWRKGQDIM